MGAWGPGLFEDDAALDFIQELQNARDVGFLAETIGRVAASSAYIEYDDGTRALAAAEVLAALSRRPGAELPPLAAAWVSRRAGDDSASLVASAISAVETVIAGSEIAELWSESEEANSWRTNVDDLLARLRSVAR